jgi:hypothetical protein
MTLTSKIATRPALVSLAIALGVLAASSSAPAAELLLEDVTTVLDESTQCFYMFPIPASAPADWTAPDDYFQGTVELRFEILSQPTSRASNLQLCIYALDADETCSPLTPISGPNVVVTDSSSPADWWYLNQPFDFAHPELWDYLFNTLWDDQGCMLMNGEACWPQRADYLPMTVRMTAVAVSAGSTFSGWDNYPPGGGGGGSGGAAGAGGGAGGGNVGGAGAGNVGGTGAGNVGGAGGSSPPGGAAASNLADGDDGGCSCRAAGLRPGPASLLSLWPAVVLLRARRRRRAFGR